MNPTPAAPTNAIKAQPDVSFAIDLFQGGNKIEIKLTPKKAKRLIRAVIKRNLRDFPITLVDIHGMAHTIRGIDRASYPASLVSEDDGIVIS